ncbi:intraflagellar transport protein 43 homolog [Drosophila guanche]|uniref:Blast:Intraflagellar transport protein 43 homolog n=1 Tax=Drosophila guanche TaxID=7266 RepID=A0A3B0KAN3_DROGU|nr:intraflagellar transport protein 43 homolog [Drosophila guanche]SPP82101.1 blast:Intraflagellar transport protein 43 homolog [Drosophila guanche]
MATCCLGNAEKINKLAMDWAEELKMTIRKTTARKGRRSKSRDVLKEESSQPVKDISIDITLNVQAQGSPTTTEATSSTYNNEFESHRPPIRRISGGWADAGFKGLKSKKHSFDDERFQQTKSATSVPTDDIPVIPDVDDFKDEIMLNEIVEPPTASLNRLAVLKEISTDLLSQHAFNAVDNFNLSILTDCLLPQETLNEVDEIWQWDKLFTEVSAEIHSDKAPNIGVKIGPDVVPPAAQHT